MKQQDSEQRGSYRCSFGVCKSCQEAAQQKKLIIPSVCPLLTNMGTHSLAPVLHCPVDVRNGRMLLSAQICRERHWGFLLMLSLVSAMFSEQFQVHGRLKRCGWGVWGSEQDQLKCPMEAGGGTCGCAPSCQLTLQPAGRWSCGATAACRQHTSPERVLQQRRDSQGAADPKGKLLVPWVVHKKAKAWHLSSLTEARARSFKDGAYLILIVNLTGVENAWNTFRNLLFGRWVFHLPAQFTLFQETQSMLMHVRGETGSWV